MPKEVFNKITIFIVGSSLIAIILVGRLFQLQVMAHDYYQEIATREQYGVTELPAQRGEILIQDEHSGEEFPLATNITLNLLFVDPTIIKDPVYVSNTLAPLIFDIEEERAKENERIKDLAKNSAAEVSPEELEKLLTPHSDAELEENFKKDLINKVSQKQRQEILLATG